MGLTFRAALAISVAVAASPALAQDVRVRQIVIQGTQRIEPETVKSYMAIAEGDPYNSDRIDRSLKALFNTGLFADVTIRQEGSAVVVRVVENPIINRIAFEGNKRIKTEELTQETQLRPRVVYTRAKVQSDLKRILDLYRRNGRFAATVDPKIIQLEQNRVDLVFEISEGEPTYVQRINFIGNKHFDDARLRDILQTKEERWYRFFSVDDTYDPDRVTYDRELLRRFYLKSGYADFKVMSSVAELTPDREAFFLTFTVEEGERYKLGKVVLKSSIRDLDIEQFRQLVTISSGDWYNADKVEDIVQKLTDAVGSKGFPFVDVKPQINRDPDRHVIDVTYDVQEGPRIYVERIDISGNVRTLDSVIRREFKLVEGDAFNSAKLRRSRQRIRDLNFFEKVEVNNVPSESAPDRTIIKVDVSEKSTGELSFGVGWSTTSGPLAEASIRERNLLGRGQDVHLSASVGTRRDNFQFSFTEPYFLERQVAAGFDLFAINRRNSRQASYDSSTQGTSVRAGYQIHEALRQDVKYTLKQDKVENVSDTASTFIREQVGASVTSSISQSLLWDYRDSKQDPTEGYFVRLGTELAGLGGDTHFVRTVVGAGQYYPLADRWILQLTGNIGSVYGYGSEKVRITDRFYLGGDTMRGFANFGISPRDGNSGDPLGGLWEYHGTAQVKFPLGLPEELGVGGELFTDVGGTGPTENYPGGGIQQSSVPRVAIGTGLTWKSPMGPVAVDFAVPVMKQSYDKTEFLKFNFGSRF